MNETVTVEYAVARGRKLLVFIPLIILLAFIFGFLYLISEFKMPWWLIVVGFTGGIVFSWGWWNYNVLKWKLWAFENVRNVHELKKEAIAEKLIYADTSIFAKTEFQSKSFKAKWATLENKFLKEDYFEEDFSIPEETSIFYSRTQAYGGLVLFILIISGGIYLFLDGKSRIVGLFCIAIGCYALLTTVRKLFNKNPQIVISNTGIQTSKVPFVEWSKITGEDAVREGFGKNARDYFVYTHPGGVTKIEIGEFDTRRAKLLKLLIHYRGRNRKHSERDHNHK
jgi:hypothetical protein